MLRTEGVKVWELKVEEQGDPSCFYDKNYNHFLECQGANNGEKRNLIKALIKSQKADLICLQETKLKGVLNKLVQSLGAGRCMDWVAANVTGASGGIIIFCDSRVL